MAYKWCIVPMCKNSTTKTPEKVFVNMPFEKERRTQWLMLCRRDPKHIKSHTAVFICEDHFDKEKDFNNYLRYKHGYSNKLVIRKDAVPTKFNFQQDSAGRIIDSEVLDTNLYKAFGIAIDTNKSDTSSIKEEPLSSASLISVADIKQEDVYVCGTIIDDQFVVIDESTIKAEISSDKEDLDEETCLKNFLKSEITIDYDIKQDDEGTHKCTLCHKLFSYKHILFEHLQECKKKRKHQCTICKRAFKQKTHLKQHLIIHEGIKRFKCTICDKAFIHNYYLTQHLLIHKGIKRFSCIFCDRTFSRNYDLTQHLSIHTGVKAIKCRFCDEAFNRKYGLRRHLLIHKGSKPFKCKVCKLKFSQRCALNQHLLMHNED